VYLCVSYVVCRVFVPHFYVHTDALFISGLFRVQIHFEVISCQMFVASVLGSVIVGGNDVTWMRKLLVLVL
jgi:hypothetical protein